MAHLWPLIRLLSVFFQQMIQILHQINVKKCPTSMQCRDSNSRPSDYESPLLTTRPGFPNTFRLFNDAVYLVMSEWID